MKPHAKMSLITPFHWLIIYPIWETITIIVCLRLDRTPPYFHYSTTTVETIHRPKIIHTLPQILFRIHSVLNRYFTVTTTASVTIKTHIDSTIQTNKHEITTSTRHSKTWREKSWLLSKKVRRKKMSTKITKASPKSII